VAREYQHDHLGDLAASTTFFLLLSIPAGTLAFVSALGSLGSIIGEDLSTRARDAVIEAMEDVLTGEADQVVAAVDALFDRPKTGLLTLSLLIALFTLSRAFAAVIRAFDSAYDTEETRPFWYQRIVAIGLAVGSVVVAAGLVVTDVVLWRVLPDWTLLEVLRVPVLMVGATMWAATLFHIGPNVRSPWRWNLPGALFAAAGWSLLAVGFRFYVYVTGGANQVLGIIGGALLALTFLYLVNVVLLAGAELNAVLAQRAGVLDQMRPIRQRVAEQLQALQRALED